MTELATPPVHLVSAAVLCSRAALAEVAGSSVWSMDAEQTAITLDEVRGVRGAAA